MLCLTLKKKVPFDSEIVLAYDEHNEIGRIAISPNVPEDEVRLTFNFAPEIKIYRVGLWNKIQADKENHDKENHGDKAT